MWKAGAGAMWVTITITTTGMIMATVTIVTMEITARRGGVGRVITEVAIIRGRTCPTGLVPRRRRGRFRTRRRHRRRTLPRRHRIRISGRLRARFGETLIRDLGATKRVRGCAAVKGLAGGTPALNAPRSIR